MIPYDDLERALARWKARAHAAVDSTQSGELGGDARPREQVNGRSRSSSELSGEIDINELAEVSEE